MKITGFDLNKIFSEHFVKATTPKYQLLTDVELEQVWISQFSSNAHDDKDIIRLMTINTPYYFRYIYYMLIYSTHK